jgi:hypothetical protein
VWSIFTTSKIGHPQFCFFWKQKAHNWNKFYDVDCRAFHAASCGIFCLLIKRIQRCYFLWKSNRDESVNSKFILHVYCKTFCNGNWPSCFSCMTSSPGIDPLSHCPCYLMCDRSYCYIRYLQWRKGDSCESHRQSHIWVEKSETLFFRTNDHCLLNEALLSIERKEMDNRTMDVYPMK